MKLDAAIERSSGLLDTAGNKMAFASTSARMMAAETAEIAASAQATAKAAAATAAATGRMRLSREPRALPYSGGGMPPVFLPPRERGEGGRRGRGEGGGFIGAAEGLGEGAGIGYLARRAFSVPGLAAGFAGYEAFKNAIQTQFNVQSAVELFDPAALRDAKRLAADEKRMDELARRTAIGTIYTTTETAQAYQMLAFMLRTAPAFQGPQKFAHFEALAPIVLRASEVATMQHLGTLEENMIAMTRYAHLLGAYAPKLMTAASNQLLATAEVTHEPLTRLEKIMAYSVPLARGLGVSVSDTALITGALIQGGLGQKAGVAVARILTGMLQTGGPITASLQTALDTLGSNAVHYKGKQLKSHILGLHELGILNAAGSLTVTDKAGDVVWSKVIAAIDAASKRLPKQAFANAVYAAFGMRGSRAANLLPVLGKLVDSFEKAVTETPTALQQQMLFAQTTQQQLQQLLARVIDVGNALATFLLPALNKLLDVLLAIFNEIDGFLANPLAALPRIEIPSRPLVTASPLSSAPLVVHQGSGLAGAIHRRAMGEVPAVHIETTNNVTVNAPPGADGHAIGQHVGRAIQQRQEEMLRRTFRDLGYASVGGFSP